MFKIWIKFAFWSIVVGIASRLAVAFARGERLYALEEQFMIPNLVLRYAFTFLNIILSSIIIGTIAFFAWHLLIGRKRLRE